MHIFLFEGKAEFIESKHPHSNPQTGCIGFMALAQDDFNNMYVPLVPLPPDSIKKIQFRIKIYFHLIHINLKMFLK